jgi:hypothetical protein
MEQGMAEEAALLERWARLAAWATDTGTTIPTPEGMRTITQAMPMTTPRPTPPAHARPLTG